VQILGDAEGNVVHLFERDCSVQRRHQKIVEIAPAPNLEEGLRKRILDDAVTLAQDCNYQNAGTAEFLVDKEGRHYFIEMNARLQVEHTVTEEVTGVDLVQSQLRIAAGETLPGMGITQDKIEVRGSAVQCRVTTEDPDMNFTPDVGKLEVYSVGEGLGVRLDQSGYQGLEITPHYDSLLAKVTTRGPDFEAACKRAVRALDEFEVRGVKTNIGFIKNVLAHPNFISGEATTYFLDQHPELFTNIAQGGKPTAKLLRFIAEVLVNGPTTPLGVPSMLPHKLQPVIPGPAFGAEAAAGFRGFKHVLTEQGPEGFAKAVRAHEGCLFTDTTWRDAHQSLLATRVRTTDILQIAPQTDRALRQAYSIENWGGATFDVALRFLHECPWDRLEQMREQAPNVPFQMLLRGANAVGYTAYPDNVVFKFCEQAVKSGMDVFRVFDSLNYMENMKIGMNAVGEAGGVIEAAISYTGDVSNPNETKYTLDYYLELTRQLVAEGAHVLAIKDMAGLLKPRAANMLVSAIRAEFPDLPIHVHCHDTSGNGVASMLECARAGADAVDAAVDSMSGMTSQPSMGALAVALESEGIKTGVDLEDISTLSEYWEVRRGEYAPFESTVTMKSGTADVYKHQIPGGQYTNLHFQAFSLGQSEQWPLIKRAYAQANEALGDIVKVTPSSKVVGDLALFMVQNELDKDSLLAQADKLNFPTSVVEFFQGYLGQPLGGFPAELQSKVLKLGTSGAMSIVEGRPGADMPAFDFDAERVKLEKKWGKDAIEWHDVISSSLYPAVFDEYMTFQKQYGNVDRVPTRCFFGPMDIGEELAVPVSESETLNIRCNACTDADSTGRRQLFFEVNGDPIAMYVTDAASMEGVVVRAKATDDVSSVGAPMPGKVVGLRVEEGTVVAKDTPLVVLSAMKMETIVTAPITGLVKNLTVQEGDSLSGGDLLLEIVPTESIRMP